MIPKPFDQITGDDIQALCDRGQLEGRRLDFKDKAWLDGVDFKEKLRALAVAFANTLGGDIVIGVREKELRADAVDGLERQEAEAAEQTVTNVLSDGTIEPRMPGVHVQACEVSGKYVIVVRVPQSWHAPHMIKSKSGQSYKMSKRSGTHVQWVDAGEMRQAFSSGLQIADQLESWRHERVMQVAGGNSPVPLQGRERLILHIQPYECLFGEGGRTAEKLEKHATDFLPLGTSGANPLFNVDGLLMDFKSCDAPPHAPHVSYCQVWRNGRIESVIGRDLFARFNEEHPRIPSSSVEQYIIQDSSRMIGALRSLGIEGPVSLSVSLTGCEGVPFGVNAGAHARESRAIDRDLLLLTSVSIEDRDDNLPASLRPVFDVLWNACGYPRSYNYSQDGQYVGDH